MSATLCMIGKLFEGCGCSSVVEHDLAKVGVASSSLVTRSIKLKDRWTGAALVGDALFLCPNRWFMRGFFLHLAAAVLVVLTSGTALAQDMSVTTDTPQTLSVAGLWDTPDHEAVIEIYSCDENEFCGRFYWLKDDDAVNPSRDDKNPDSELRKRPLCGLTFLGGFSDEGNGMYGSGWVYSPRHGSTYSASIRLVDAQTLEMTGYMFLPFLGKSQRWHRLESSPKCHLLEE